MSSVAGANRSTPVTVDLTVVILTYNEERHIERSIASVSQFAREILLVDSGSTDRTVGLAVAAGARVLTHKFVNQSQQFQWALDHGKLQTAWVMRLDADEIIEPDLQEEIVERLPTLGAEVAGINLLRKHIFLGRWVRHGGRFPLVLLRIWRMGQGRIEKRWMDEHIVVSGGRTVSFSGGFADVNMNDITFFTDKHNKYATREAIDVLTKKYKLGGRGEVLSAKSSSLQASLKRNVKERIYNRLPLWLGPLGYFLYRYFFQLGFLDGKSGLIYHALQGFWYRFLVNAKVFEYEIDLRGCHTDSERLATLSRLTGYDLTGPTAQPSAPVTALVGEVRPA